MKILRNVTAVLLCSVAAVALTGCGPGGGTVYVGVGVGGPWGYPGAYPGGYYPRPGFGRPCCYRDDAQDVEENDLIDADLMELADDQPPALTPDPDWLSRLR